VQSIPQSPQIFGPVNRLGLPKSLIWGFIAVLLFMTGDGIETNYLSIYIVNQGFTQHSASLVIMYYGITAAIGAVLAGTISAWAGPRQAMLWGGIIWIVFEILFLTVAIPSNQYSYILITYAIRGFGYPLFAYGFLVWINAVTPLEHRGAATGWFWAAFSAGFPTLGSLIASGAVPVLGQGATLWLSLGVVVLGFLIAMIGLREPVGRKPLSTDGAGPLRQLQRSFEILCKHPKIARAVILRLFNTAPQIASFVYLPFFFTEVVKMSLQEYLAMIFIVYSVCMFSCMIMGRVSDRFGWRKTITWVGTVGGAVGTLLTYYGALAVGNNFWLCALLSSVYGIALAGYTPLTALITTLKGESSDDGTILSLYCMGAGVSVFLGPAIVSAFMPSIGVEGLIWLFTGFYIVAIPLSLSLRSDLDPGEKPTRTQSGAIVGKDLAREL